MAYYKTHSSKRQMTDIRRKKRILYLSTKSVLGGAQRYIVDLVDYLPKDQFECAVAAGGYGNLATKIKERAIPYFEIRGLDRDLSILADVIAFGQILRIIKKFHPDILHLNGPKISGLGAVAGRLLGVPKIISSTHGWPFLEARPSWQKKLIKFFTKIGILFQDSIICVSDFDYRTALHERIAPERKLVSIHNGVDSKKHIFLPKSEAREKLFQNLHRSLPKETFVVGAIAEYTRNKGLLYLIEATSHVINIKPKVVFVLIGWGEQKAELLRSIHLNHMEDHVFLIDHLPTEAFAYLKAFDLFILPSLKEGFAYTLLEASLAELPIITTRVGGNPEIIENFKTGLLVEPASPEEIISAISHLMANPKDRESFGEAARKNAISNFPILSMVQMTGALYQT